MLLTHSTAVLCAVFIITGAVSGEDVKKAVGGTVSFRLDKLGSPVNSFTWKHINGVMVVKVIEWDVDDGVYIPNPRFQGITTLDEKTGQITITNLKVEHSGIYTIDINSKEQQQRFSLTVMALSKESDPGLIAGIVIGVLLLIIAIILIYLLVKLVHERVNKICPCIPKFFGPLDCLLKMIEGEPKDSQPNDAASKPLNETTSP